MKQLMSNNLLYGLCIGVSVLSLLNIDYQNLQSSENIIWYVNVALAVLLFIGLHYVKKKQ